MRSQEYRAALSPGSGGKLQEEPGESGAIIRSLDGRSSRKRSILNSPEEEALGGAVHPAAFLLPLTRIVELNE